MANHRMFSLRIANSARFLQMPSESQLFYFHLVLRADDDGVVESYPIIQLLKTPPDAIKVLIAKDLIRPINEDQVIVITDWLEHNKIRADRKVDSIYKQDLLLSFPNISLLVPKARSDVVDNSRRLGGQSTDGISKDKLSKDKLINMSASADAFNQFWSKYPKKELKKKTKEIWERKRLSTHLMEILDFIDKAAKTDRWKKGFIKQPPAFLNGECWNDDLSAYNEIVENNRPIKIK